MQFTPLHRSKKSFRDGVQWAWDATSLDIAQACGRKYYYSLILGIKPKELSVHLLFGGIYAKALEHFYKYRAEGADIETATLKVVREALEGSWVYETELDEAGLPTYKLDENGNRIGRPASFDDPKKTRVALIRTIVWYIEQFGVETEDGLSTYILQNGKPAVELSFTLDLAENIFYCGHLDRVAKMGEQLYVMDQKTTGGTVGPYYFSNFEMSNQMSGYALAGQMVLKSPISGVIIDAAQIAVNFTRFERGITPRSKDRLDEWLSNTIRFLDYFQALSADAGEEEDRWPMNLTACGNYGGCEYRLLCSRSPKVRKSFLSDFRPHNWDPVQAR